MVEFYGMIRGKKVRRDFNKIGKNCYGFDFVSERNIYCYLCCYHIKRRELRKLQDNLKFDTYRQWKRYVNNKYFNLSKEQLVEFSRYLNCEIRNISSFRKYWDIITPILLSILFAKICEAIISIYSEFLGTQIEIMLLITLLLEVLIIMILTPIIIKMMYPFFDSNIDENFYTDYKEIIDEIIVSKTSKELL